MNTRKLFLIFKREYTTRLKSKTFIWSTILVPIGFLLVFLAPMAINWFSSDAGHTIGILDRTQNGQAYEQLEKLNPDRYIPIEEEDESVARSRVLAGELDGYIVFSNKHLDGNANPKFVYKGGGIALVNQVENNVRSVLRDIQLDRANLSPELVKRLKDQTQLQTVQLTSEGEQQDSSIMLFIFGYGMALIIYLAVIMYGTIIMRGVIQEKSNRIVEIIISSVKPFELLMGKVLGVGALGLTQFIIWISVGLGITSFLAPLLLALSGDAGAAAQQSSQMSLPSINPIIWVYLILYFILGYLMYSALFAAVGAAADNESDTQQLSLPVMIPIILAIVFLPQVASSPDSTMAIVTSLIPFFSPILMLARIPITDVPVWQILLSFVILSGTFIAFIALSAKIYRVGILMYGKKPSFSEIAKWLRYR